VLQHACMLEDLSAAGWARWREEMRRFAACPTVVCKLLGLGTFIHRNNVDHVAAIVQEAVGMFGPTRCLFESNFPIEKLWTRYADLVTAYRLALERLGAATARAALSDTAAKIYRLHSP